MGGEGGTLLGSTVAAKPFRQTGRSVCACYAKRAPTWGVTRVNPRLFRGRRAASRARPRPRGSAPLARKPVPPPARKPVPPPARKPAPRPLVRPRRGPAEAGAGAPGRARVCVPPASICRNQAFHLILTRREGPAWAEPRVERPPSASPPGGGQPLGVSPYYGWGRVRSVGGGEPPSAVLNLALRRRRGAYGDRRGGRPHPRGVGLTPREDGPGHQRAGPPPADTLLDVALHRPAPPAHRPATPVRRARPPQIFD
ncbi:hypothetical protein QFZ56_003283 [Streptomyces achromogenes]|uniref:Basic proline-rich protein-like n=1 Tax=Streptomyces achromogenes TaxID=67255 RepID=A0ABU0Q0X6_STRAH|nr:hypothetical protein [Streptomyces achromogenes]